MNVEERAKILGKRVEKLYLEWKVDPAGFIDRYPDIQVAQEASHGSSVLAMEAIAAYCANGTGFKYRVVPVIAGNPRFFVGRSDQRNAANNLPK